MSASESNSTSERSSSEATQREDGENRDAIRPAGESPGSVQVEQSVAVAPGLEPTVSQYQTGLVTILSKVTSDPVAVNHAVADLRALIEEAVRREIGILRKETNAAFKTVEAAFKVVEAKFASMGTKFGSMEIKLESMGTKLESRIESLESQFKTFRWIMGAVITLLVANLATTVALIVLLINLMASEDRSGTALPPPPSATVQAPAKSETVPPTGAVPGREDPAIAAPGGTAVTADQPADESTP